MSENPGREMKVTDIQFPPKKLNSKNTRDVSLSPGMNGSGGFSWYFPRHMSISAKFIPQLWIATLTWWNFSKRKRFIKQKSFNYFFQNLLWQFPRQGNEILHFFLGRGEGVGWSGLLESKLSNLFNKQANSLYLDERPPRVRPENSFVVSFSFL